MAPKHIKADKKRLVLLDTHAIIHRAYHAIPEFSSASGEPTGALYGLTSMLFKIIEVLKPDYIVAARDRAEKTHRHDVYEAYKGTRAETEDALVVQLERAPRIFEAFGIPVYDAAGFEADDVIGTIVKKLEKNKDIEIVIASGDLDTLQLVSKDVRVFTPRTGLNDTVMYDEEATLARFGFRPEQMVDYKGLRGDPSDNIKGVPGVGEKTATELIQKFGSVKNIYSTLKRKPKEFEKKGIKPRVVNILRENEDAAIFSTMLATIRTDAPIKFALPEAEWHVDNHLENILSMCDEFDFRSLKDRARLFAKKKLAESQMRLEMTSTESARAMPSADALTETSVALWLLRSDLTDPSLDDIERYTKQKDFDAAHAAVFRELRETGRLHEVFANIEKPLIPIVRAMGEVGVLLDTKYLSKLAHEYGVELSNISAQIYEYAGREFNVSSPKQLAVVLFDELKLAMPRMKKTALGARSTREDELLKLKDQHEIVELVLEYRELQKLLSTYIESLPKLIASDGRVHARFVQAGTTTGRMSSESPNLQNIPISTPRGRRIRNAFVAKKGFLLAAIDYSQIELRVAAALSNDKKLIDVFRRGGDIHSAVASEVFSVPPEAVDKEMRRRAKVINFGILYGMGVNALRQNLGESVTRDEAANFLHRYFEDFPGLAHYIERTKADAARLGYTETLFGRRRHFAGFRSPLPNIRAQAERMAINAPIQGTQADIIKLAMVKADEVLQERGWSKDVHLLMQVHDELVYEVREEKAETITRALREVMEGIVDPKLLNGVPIVATASIGHNWGEMRNL